jgi:hypothetical protein
LAFLSAKGRKKCQFRNDVLNNQKNIIQNIKYYKTAREFGSRGKNEKRPLAGR